jgi:hypothetical protein
MTDRRRNLLRVLAVLLLAQWAAALQPCLRGFISIASAQAVELCSPEGIHRTVLVDHEGKPVQPAKHHVGCPLCQQASPAILPAAPGMLARAAAFPAVEQSPAWQGLPPMPARAPPQQPRAPPFA